MYISAIGSTPSICDSNKYQFKKTNLNTDNPISFKVSPKESIFKIGCRLRNFFDDVAKKYNKTFPPITKEESEAMEAEAAEKEAIRADENWIRS